MRCYNLDFRMIRISSNNVETLLRKEICLGPKKKTNGQKHNLENTIKQQYNLSYIGCTEGDASPLA